MRPSIDRPGLAVRAGGAVAFALLALLTAGSQAGTGATAMSETYVFYSRSVGSAGTLGGSFTADAALVRTDASLPRIPRIGVFRRAMEPGAWGGLAAAIRSLGAPRPSGVQKPGTPMVSLGIMTKGKAEVVHSQPEGALTPGEREVFSKASALVDEVLQHPHQALESGAEWESASVAPGEDVRLRVRVGNPGLVPVSFASPVSTGGAASSLSLVLVRVGPGGEPAGTGEVGFGPAEVVPVEPDGKPLGGTPDDVIHLAPGKDVRFRATSRLRLPPASYRASLRLVVAAPPDAGEKAVSGTIEVDLPALAVVRPGTQGGTR